MLIFIKPPSLQVLTERLTNRKTEDIETIRQRLERVPMELAQAEQFDAAVINDDLQKAFNDVDEIICHAMDVAKQ